MPPTHYLNGDAFADLAGFYDEVERRLTRGLDWRIGRNLDALNDVLRGGFGVHDFGHPLRLVWQNSAKSRTDLGHVATAMYWTDLAAHCHPSNLPHVQAQLAQAQRGQGPTFFDLVVNLIQVHHLGYITLELR